jgi:uncharacterized protein (TIGR03083 family)
MTNAPANDLAALIQAWRQATIDLVVLARSLDRDQWELPTDLEGWNVKDVVAHCAHLEAILAGAPEETIDIGSPPHVKNLMGTYTEQGVAARREHSMDDLCREIETSSRNTHARLAENPPTDPAAAPPISTPGGVPWNAGTLFSNRPLDIWMHEQDIRRAIDLPGGYGSPAAAHTIGVLGAGLGMVIGKRVKPPEGTTVQFEVPATDSSRRLVVRDGRAVEDTSNEPADVRLTFTPEDFVVLTGGRRTPDQAEVKIEGDQELGRAILAALAITP